MLLQVLFKLTDRGVEQRIKETPSYQIFCGLNILKRWHCPDHCNYQAKKTVTAHYQQSSDAAIKRVGFVGAKVIFHSDRGSQYASEVYRKFLKSKNINPSMSRKGNCYDNAYVESWFSSLKKEWIYRRSYKNKSELKALVFEYIKVWYNKKRRHSSFDYQSPEGYRINHKIA